MYFFARLRIDLQIGIFGIIVQDSDFPEIPLQNCKSDMTTSLSYLKIIFISLILETLKNYLKISTIYYIKQILQIFSSFANLSKSYIFRCDG
jgi:hypothetical protein